MHLQNIDPRLLAPNPWNTNLVSPENMAKLAASLERHGWVRPVIARQLEDGKIEILGGQHRVEAAISIGHREVPVLNLGEVDDRRAKEIGLIDNARYGADDALSLAELLDELGGHELATFLPYSDAELASLSTSIDVDLDHLDLDEPKPKEPDKRPPRTHQVMRFKVPIDDADDVSDAITEIQTAQGFADGDSLTNAGDALVWSVARLRELGAI